MHNQRHNISQTNQRNNVITKLTSVKQPPLTPDRHQLYLCLPYPCTLSILLFLNLPFNPSALSLSISPNLSISFTWSHPILLHILPSLPIFLSLFCPYPYILYLPFQMLLLSTLSHCLCPPLSLTYFSY